MGKYTATSVSVIAITGRATSLAPISAASRGCLPSSICRCTFSTTTIASSTTSPIAITIASSVSRLIEKPINQTRNKTVINDSGMATIGIATTRNEPRNNRMTSTTIMDASINVLPTSSSPSRIYIDRSESKKIVMSAGSCVSISFTLLFTRAATSRGLAPGASVIAMNTVSLPLE